MIQIALKSEVQQLIQRKWRNFNNASRHDSINLDLRKYFKVHS